MKITEHAMNYFETGRSENFSGAESGKLRTFEVAKISLENLSNRV